jgi:hypothetical protein
VNEFFFDSFAFGMVADDASAAVPFEDLHLESFSPADSLGDFRVMRGSFLGGFRFRRTRMRVMRGRRSIVRWLKLRQPFAVSRIFCVSLCGFWRLAPFRQLQR